MNLHLSGRMLWLGMGVVLAACSATPSAGDGKLDPVAIAAVPTATNTAPAPVLPPPPSPTTTLPTPTAAAMPTLSSPTPTPTPTAPPAPASDFGPAPEIQTEVWLNTQQPLRLAELRGKVVLVDFWTFG